LDQKIESYIRGIVSRLNCSEEEKRDIMDEMRDHLHLLKSLLHNFVLKPAS